jgi:hypothetical protein
MGRRMDEQPHTTATNSLERNNSFIASLKGLGLIFLLLFSLSAGAVVVE